MTEATTKVWYLIRYTRLVHGTEFSHEVELKDNEPLPEIISNLRGLLGENLGSLKVFKVITTEKEVTV